MTEDAADLGGSRINRIDFPGKPGLQQIAQGQSRSLCRIGRGANDGDGLRLKKKSYALIGQKSP